MTMHNFVKHITFIDSITIFVNLCITILNGLYFEREYIVEKDIILKIKSGE